MFDDFSIYGDISATDDPLLAVDELIDDRQFLYGWEFALRYFFEDDLLFSFAGFILFGFFRLSNNFLLYCFSLMLLDGLLIDFFVLFGWKRSHFWI